MTSDVPEFVVRFLTCLRVKGEQRRPQGKTQSLEGVSIIFVGTCLVLLSLFSHNVITTTHIKSHAHPALDAGNTFNVINFGAIGDGITDDTKLQGTIVAPSSFVGWTKCTENSWMYFGYVQGLQFTGSGKIDGRGSLWWRKRVPPALRFHNCNGLQVKGTTHVDSPMNHIEVEASQNVEMSQLNIVAPFDSPNTDGIDIASSSHVYIHQSFIGTGDDCIALKGESYFVNITGIHCGPGHGISVGSLGEGGATDVVENVFVRNCTLNGTTNGARIKTWQGGSGHVSGVTFEGIILVNSKHPIIIDQSYTDGAGTGAVQVTDVTFRGFLGTSATGEAISLQCSGKLPCTNLKLDNIDIRSTSTGKNVVSKCQFAHGIIVPPVVPNVTCLLK
ncbi:putative polygalacturonase At3g15720 [Silene latifolia]|uniref:putative polygalacturonase At3g15720 n=1 Tax=Silene latifolia TaxID=37657 RepID=UPI003D77B0B6